jgi:hypothetical protein
MGSNITSKLDRLSGRRITKSKAIEEKNKARGGYHLIS